MSFSVLEVNGKSYSYLNGSWILSQLSVTEGEEQRMCDVVFTEGHWAVLSHKRQVLSVFDNCPSNLSLDIQNQRKLFKEINQLHNLNAIPEKAGEEPIFLLSLSGSDLYFSKISFILSGKDIRLFALLNSGELYCWKWFQGIERDVYRWKWDGKYTLTEGLTISIKDIFFFSNSFHIAWWESDSSDSNLDKQIMLNRLGKQQRQYNHRICHQTLYLEKNGKFTLVKKLNGVIVQGFDEILQFQCTEKGTWILTSNELGFWPFGSKTNNFTFYNLDKDSFSLENYKHMKTKKQPTHPENILRIIRHVNSDDLLIIEESGRILVASFSPMEEIITCFLICSLDFQKNELLSIHGFFAQKTNLLLFSTNYCYIFDIRSGILLDKLLLPNNFSYEELLQKDRNESLYSSLGNIWYSKHQIGCWRSGKPIIEITYPSVNQQISTLSKKISKSDTSKFPVNYLGQISKQWNLDKSEAKYTFEELLKYTRERDSHDKIESSFDNLIDIQEQLAKELHPMLENPSFLLLLLREKYHKPYLHKIVSEFLDGYLSSSKEDADRIDIRKGYHSRTPLNGVLISLIDHYNQLSEQQMLINITESKKIAGEDADSHWMMEYLESGESLITASRTSFELVVHQFPEKSLEVLENYLGLSNIWKDSFMGSEAPEQTFFVFSELLSENHLLLKTNDEFLTSDVFASGRTKNHPLFMSLCRLYYRLKPLYLLPFISLVQQSYNKIHNITERLFIDKSVIALPIFLFDKEDTKLNQTQTIVKVTLLCWAGMGQRAMNYLLEQNQWDKILIIMRKYKFEEKRIQGTSFTPQSELFYMLLAWCIKHNDIEHIQQLWEFIPNQFGVLNLLRIIQMNQPKSESPFGDSLVDPPPSILSSNPESQLTVGTFKEQMIHMFNTTDCSKYFPNEHHKNKSN